MTKIEREKKKEDRLIVLSARIRIYNSLAPEINEWVIKYWKALKEIWQTPITTKLRNDEILGNYGLKYALKYGWGLDYWWEPRLKEINKLIFSKKEL